MFLADFGWAYFFTQAMPTEKSGIVGKLMSCLVEVNILLVKPKLGTFSKNCPKLAPTNFRKN